MDGNGRWAQSRGMKRIEGHREGAEAVDAVTKTCRRLGLDYLTLYAFSEENWQRPKTEVEGLMRLLNRFLKTKLDYMIENGVQLRAMGDLDKLPAGSRKLLEDTMSKTNGCRDLVLTLALSYGARQEIVSACRQMAKKVEEGIFAAEDINEDVFAAHLYTPETPDPDLLIRTGGEHRVSNFLLWQIAYTELYITPTFWPDFREDELHAALLDYQGRQRRFGRTGDQVVKAGRKKSGAGR
jgi:undecaprenyl diphosphate synthase